MGKVLVKLKKDGAQLKFYLNPDGSIELLLLNTPGPGGFVLTTVIGRNELMRALLELAISMGNNALTGIEVEDVGG